MAGDKADSRGSGLASMGRGHGTVVIVSVYALALAVGAWASVHVPPMLPPLPAFPGLPARASDVVWATLIGDIAGTVFVWCVSQFVAHNPTVYDIYWSVAPPILAAVFATCPAAAAGVPLRQAVALCLITAWGVRLTCNWWLVWIGFAHRDFRYSDMEVACGGGVLYALVNLTGLHMYPTLHVFGMCLGLCAAMVGTASVWWLDYAGWACTLVGVVFESVGDAQLRRWRATAVKGASINVGLWAFVRHPNYLGEILTWVGVAATGIAACPDASRAALVLPVLALVALFVCYSVPEMENRQLQRRRSYRDYMVNVPSALFPGIW